jgi:hypothetical protein
MPSPLTLGEFVKQLTALLEREEISIPFKNERPWHYLFYELKKSKTVGRPQLFDELEFDWDGPFPKSQELSDFLHALHWNASVSANNPHYETINLPNDVRDLWFSRYDASDTDTKTFFNLALDRAREEFGRETRLPNNHDRAPQRA